MSDPTLEDQIRALKESMRLLEDSAAMRFSLMSRRIGALEEHMERFTREASTPTDD